MRFLVLMIPGASSSALAARVLETKNGPPTPADSARLAREMEQMGQFNDRLKQAGALLSVDGLLSLKAGARLSFADGSSTVIDGPSILSKEVVGGYWILQAQSKQQVVDWMQRCPAQADDVIEIRQIAEQSDFPADV